MASLSSSLRGGPGVRLARGLPRPSALASRSVLTSQHVVTPSRSLFTRPKPRSPLRSIVTITLLGFAATFGVAYHLDSRSAIHRWIAIPVLQAVTDPETAQKLAVKLLSLGVMPRDMVQDDAVLETEVSEPDHHLKLLCVCLAEGEALSVSLYDPGGGIGAQQPHRSGCWI